MTRERWEVRASVNGFTVGYSLHPSTCNGPAHAREEALREAIDFRGRGLDPVIVHVRTYRVEVMYAWRQILGGYYDRHGLIVFTTKAARIYTDPLGKHSRRRAKAAALAAKPSGPCVLVAVRRRVKEQ